MGRYSHVKDFASLSMKKRQFWVDEFVRFAEKDMSSKRKGRYHRLIVRYVWRQLNGGALYVTADDVVRWIRAVHKRNKSREKGRLERRTIRAATTVSTIG
jgi:hypothetical protein